MDSSVYNLGCGDSVPGLNSMKKISGMNKIQMSAELAITASIHPYIQQIMIKMVLGMPLTACVFIRGDTV